MTRVQTVVDKEAIARFAGERGVVCLIVRRVTVTVMKLVLVLSAEAGGRFDMLVVGMVYCDNGQAHSFSLSFVAMD
jgi:hypothetical protein